MVAQKVRALSESLMTSDFGGEPLDVLVCPVCSGDYVGVGQTERVSGNDNYEAWMGRGNLLVVSVDCEGCSGFDICFGFHKGQTFVYTR